MISARAYDLHVEQLFEKMRRITSVLDSARIAYRIVGAMGVFLQVDQVEPECARMRRTWT